jgi:hypothetical protein
METDGTPVTWLLFLAQLPSSPSSARVAVWRRLRTVGATSVLNGTWVLPHTAAHAQVFEQLLGLVQQYRGSGFVLSVAESAPGTDAAIVARFRADRGREYDELAERCTAFRTEIRKETRAGKFIFAELEEGEQDFEKLVRWLGKIQQRDFFPDERQAEAVSTIGRCRQALEDFSRAVFETEDVQQPAGPGNTWPDQAVAGLPADPADPSPTSARPQTGHAPLRLLDG